MSGRSVQDFDVFVDRCRSALSQQVAGHTGPFQTLWSHTDDVVLMGAAGSHAVGWEDVSASLSWASSQLDFHNWSAENLLTEVTENIAFTVDLEHMSHIVAGEKQERTLRASQGYRVEDGEWRVVFRHGDPMAEPVVPPKLHAN
ncbi:MAG TPA: nuclear transport factor 2 family protein [Acidimicrobiales bacterium]|nr:nuclear transport factor 2 family protein [Acidimicrobiales bacterium]